MIQVKSINNSYIFLICRDLESAIIPVSVPLVSMGHTVNYTPKLVEIVLVKMEASVGTPLDT